jgi:hypothetical protein
MKCFQCQEALVEDMKENDWLALVNLMQFLRDEERITKATYETAVDRLMRMKRYAFAIEAVLFDEPPTEQSISEAVKRLQKEWVEEDEV